MEKMLILNVVMKMLWFMMTLMVIKVLMIIIHCSDRYDNYDDG